MKYVTLVFAMVVATALAGPAFGSQLHPELTRYVVQRVAEFDQIPPDRRTALKRLAEYVDARRDSEKTISITFICTHNSRRSHLSQLWAAAAARYFGIANVKTFSGGTEATAFNPRAVAALRRCGFEIPDPAPSDNPRYAVSFAPKLKPQTCFSKLYSEKPNPQRDFCAVMTCSQADKTCPTVFGAERRLAISYVDPKVADNTPEESSTYDERCAQIAREMLYAFSLASGESPKESADTAGPPSE